MLDAGVGMSTKRNSQMAGRKAVKTAMEGMSQKPKIAIVAIDSLTRTKYNYNEVLQSIRAEIGPEVPILGSIANGVMVNERFALKSIGVMLLGGDINVDSSFKYGNSRMAYEKIADDLISKESQLPPSDKRFMLLFADGARFPPEMMSQQKKLNSRVIGLMTGLLTRIFKKTMASMWEEGKGMPSVQEMITYMFAHGWNCPIFGNVAMANLDYQNYEFFGTEVLENSYAGAILSGQGNTKFNFGYGAGALPMGIDIDITKNIGNMFLKINKKPALKGFCDAVGINPESLEELKYEDFTNYIHLFGTTEKVGDDEYSHLTVTMTDPELDHLVMSGFPFDKVPEKVSLFESNPKILLQTTEKAVAQAKEGISNPKFLLGFDCVLRNFAYGDNQPYVAQKIRETLGDDIPIMIFGSGGEILGLKKDDYYWNSFTLIPLIGGV